MITIATDPPYYPAIATRGWTDKMIYDTVHEIAVGLMDHGAVRLESGTMQSAVLIAIMSRVNPDGDMPAVFTRPE